MSGFWGYLVLGTVLPVGMPLLVALVVTKIKGIGFQPHLLLGGGQLCFFSITLSLINISQVIAVAGHDDMKPSAAVVLGLVAILAATIWALGISEVLSPGHSADETKRRITRYSFYVAGAAFLLGAIFRWKADLF